MIIIYLRYHLLVSKLFFRNCTIGSLGVIVIPEQSLVLGEAVVIAHRPVYELKKWEVNYKCTKFLAE